MIMMKTTTTSFTLSYLSFSIIQVHILKLFSPSKFRVTYTKMILLGLLTLENETERLPQNIGNEIPTNPV